MVLVKNWSFFYLFILGNIGQEHVVYDIVEEKNAFLGYKYIKFTKVEKWRFFQRGQSMVFVQNWSFFYLFILGNIGQEHVVYDIVEGKNAFLGYKYMKFKKSKNGDFSKGVSPCFWSKIGHFSIFLFQVIQARKMCFMIFQRGKTPFQTIKSRCSKSRKIEIFPKGLVHGFGPKLVFFPSFYFRQYRQENVFQDILEGKNAFLAYKNKKFIKSKN